MSIADDFQAACFKAIEECRQLGYDPTVWASMIERHGAVAAAKRLVETSTPQPGFERLVRAGRRDLTVEWAVLQDRWRPLFLDTHREAAQWRLDQR
ncbi:MAG TPA: hypothetical protein VEW93_06910 [Acidimicrobiales bacterium]|nr:hypothetical protein [Acidimicrobiales bacterium]